jgi:phosphonoacetate hydrolase
VGDLSAARGDAVPATRAGVHLNGIDYAWPSRPVVVVCVDGGDPAYFERGLRDGILPNVARFVREGFATVARGTVPSFTCPNNVSLVTGAPPSVHGISGNFYLDVRTGEAVPMTGPELLRSRTVLAAFADAGARVVAITAKDKLRRQLGAGLDLARGNVCFSAERVASCTLAEHGIEDVPGLLGMPPPDMYSAALSLMVLEAGIHLLANRRPDLVFLSLTDAVQHAHAPGTPQADDFMRRLDDGFGRLAALGAVVALTADHGMSDKALPDGRPNVVYLQDLLDARFGPGAARVVCPITDAFVRHHGALGGFVRIWRTDPGLDLGALLAFVRDVPGVDEALDRETACARFSLPPDREGDVAVVARADVALGGARRDHDLSALRGERLRSHGGTAEARVPFIVSAPIDAGYRAIAERGLDSWRIFDFALNGTRLHG